MYDDTAPRNYRVNQDILIEGNTICWMGPTGGLQQGDLVINAQGKLAVPGLINAHSHSSENVLRGSTERIPLEVWLVKNFGLTINYPPRLIYLMTLTGGAEMLRCGTTAVLDHFWMAEQLTVEGLNSVMQAYADLGLRATVAPMVEDRDLILDYAVRFNPSLNCYQTAQKTPLGVQLELINELVLNWHNKENGRLQCMPGPGGAQWCSSKLLTGCREIAQSNSTGIHLHLAETQVQSIVCRHSYGHSAVKELNNLGLLTAGTSLAHCIWLDDDDLDIIKEQQSVIIHNPESNLKLGSGIARLPEMLDRGIDVAIGTDGAGSNDTQNMFTALKLTGLLHSPAVRGSGAWVSAQKVIEMATRGGAKALGYKNLGRLQTGNLADFMLVDLSRIQQNPLTDAAIYLVYCEIGSAVTHVFVDGKLVVNERRIETIDESLVHQELKEIIQTYNKQNEPAHENIAPLVNDWSLALKSMLRDHGHP